ncbi:MAG: enoyl-CoA hydratase [Sandaracinus sp.]|nr:enoyl-CoA hydratase [Sandaracinus sp.]
METRPYETITATVADGVATLTLNLPERKNPLGPAMVNELLYALDDAKASDEVRAIVLTGAGKAFSAGGDLKQMGTKSELAPKGDYVDLLMRFTQLDKPTVARVPGYAMGGGLGMVASCDFAVACESAILGTPEIKRGLFPMMIMTVLQQVVPRRELMEMMLLGEKLTAADAKRVGLLSHVVPDADLDAAVAELAGRLAAQSPTAMRMGLHAFHQQREQAMAEALPYLRDQLYALLRTLDAREGLAAFFQKREPQWTGR